MPSGRKPKAFDAKRKRRYVALLDEGLTKGKAAEAVGVSPATVRRHARHDPEFGASVEKAAPPQKHGRTKGSKGEALKFDGLKQREYLELVRGGMRRMMAARAVGVDPSTVSRRMSDDEDFATAVSAAEMEADEGVEDALYNAAVSGNVTAAQVWLYNRRPDRWQDRRNLRAELTGADGGAIELNVSAEYELAHQMAKNPDLAAHAQAIASAIPTAGEAAGGN